MTKMTAMFLYGKNLKKSSSDLWNQKADDLDSWYAASGIRVLPSSLNDAPRLALTYFTARSNLVPYAIV